MKLLKITGIAMAMLLACAFINVSSAKAQAQQGDYPTQETTANTCTNIKVNLRVGARDITTGGAVSSLQSFLADNGYYAGEPTGYFGSVTLAAVKKFQGAQSLAPTGYVGPLTRGVIKKITCNGTNDATGGAGGAAGPGVAVGGNNGGGGVAGTPVRTPTPFVCPVGYICSPINTPPVVTPVPPTPPTPPVCPAGYICTYPTNPATSTTLTPEPLGGAVAPLVMPLQLARDASLQASVASADSDRAGVQYIFGPGKSNLGYPANDWMWKAALTLTSQKTIKNMELISNDGWTGWSTHFGHDNPLQKDLYPIVVTLSTGQQLNSSYDVTLGTYSAGTTYFSLYGQPETPTFDGGTLSIFFTDGTVVRATVPASSVRPTVGSTSGPCQVGTICPNPSNVQPPVLNSLSTNTSVNTTAQSVIVFGSNLLSNSGTMVLLYSTNDNTSMTISPSSVSSDGTQLTFTIPANLSAGRYVISLINRVNGVAATSVNNSLYIIANAAALNPSSLSITPVSATLDKIGATPTASSSDMMWALLTAKFTVHLKATGGNVDIGLKDSAHPFVTAASFTVNKNGQNVSTLPNTIVNYSVPAGVVVVGNGTDGYHFTIQKDAEVDLPITYTTYAGAQNATDGYYFRLSGPVTWTDGTTRLLNTTNIVSSDAWKTPGVMAP